MEKKGNKGTDAGSKSGKDSGKDSGSKKSSTGKSEMGRGEKDKDYTKEERSGKGQDMSDDE